MNNKKTATLIYIFLILQPFLDLFTSLMVRYTTFPITIGMLLRGLFLLFCIILFVKSKSIHKRKSIIYLTFLSLFCILYFITKTDIFTIEFLKTEVIYMFKYLYFPINTICLINVYDELELDKDKLFYYRGLKEYQNKTEKGYLIDTCLNAQDQYTNMIEYYLK